MLIICEHFYFRSDEEIGQNSNYSRCPLFVRQHLDIQEKDNENKGKGHGAGFSGW